MDWVPSFPKFCGFRSYTQVFDPCRHTGGRKPCPTITRVEAAEMLRPGVNTARIFQKEEPIYRDTVPSPGTVLLDLGCSLKFPGEPTRAAPDLNGRRYRGRAVGSDFKAAGDSIRRLAEPHCFALLIASGSQTRAHPGHLRGLLKRRMPGPMCAPASVGLTGRLRTGAPKPHCELLR